MKFRAQLWRELIVVLAIVATFAVSLHAQVAPPAPSGPASASDASSLKERARALAKQGDYAKAIKAFEAALAAATRAYGATDQRTWWYRESVVKIIDRRIKIQHTG